MTIVYFHGQPGSPEELGLAGVGLGGQARDLIAMDRSLDRPDLAAGDYYDHVASGLAARHPAGPIRLIGFSLGAYVAIEVALRLGDIAADIAVSLDLVSAAAPLDSGDFLTEMAGGTVFQLARDHPGRFRLLTRLQSLAAQAAPKALFAALFGKAAGGDADLAASPAFRQTVVTMMRGSLAHGAVGYRRDILGYVALRSARLAALDRPVRLWHGEADTWTPPAMARALARTMPDVRGVRTFPGLSHYSTLLAALPLILATEDSDAV